MRHSLYERVRDRLRALGNRKTEVVFSLFLLLNGALYCFSPADSFIEPDTASYLAPAHALVETGSFSSEHRLPGYPFVLAGVLAISAHVGALVVALQTVLLFLIGMVASRAAEMLVPKAGLPTLILVCFNPSALFYVQQILPDTLFTLFLILNVYFLLRACRYGGNKVAVLSGICAGILALIRGNGQYVIYLTPLALGAAYLILHRRSSRLAALRLAGLSILGALLVTLPWLRYNWLKGQGVSFVTEAYRNYALHDNVVAAIALEKGLRTAEAREIVYDLASTREGIEKARWKICATPQKHRIVAAHAFEIMSQGGLADLGLAVTKAVTKFFLVNDGQTWATFWQLSAEEKLNPEAGIPYSLSAAVKGKPPVSAITYVCHALTIVAVLFVRTMDVFGFIYLVRKRAWYLLVVLGAYVTGVAFSAGFIAYSRYRLPLDPILMVIAAWGLFAITTRDRGGEGTPASGSAVTCLEKAKSCDG